ncbi:MAG: hypothetical protein NXI31_15520 [bacterium]|nr:hypothetical protein [bacterium]
MKLSNHCLALAALAALGANTSAQTLPEGLASQTRGLPANAGNVLTLGGPGGTAWFDGMDLVRRTGTQQTTLLTFGTPVFGSFTIRAGAGNLLFGESSMGGLWLVPLNGTAPTQPLANLAFNYDAVLYEPQRAIVSAKTSGFSGPDNDLHALDLTTGLTQLLAQIPGASGPIALASNGDLYYATASLLFPTPAGQTDVLRFSRQTIDQALQNNTVLGPADATVVLAAIDSAGDLAFDNDGDLFFTDWFNNTIGEIDGADGANAAAKVFADYASVSFGGSGLQFVRSPAPADFEPFQPRGQRLLVHETEFGVLSQVRTISPRSPQLRSSVRSPVPAGMFDLEISEGPAGGSALLAIGLPSGPGVSRLDVPGFEQPLFWLDGLQQPANTYFLTLDANGEVSLPLNNPGFQPGLAIVTQAAVLDAASEVLGATDPLLTFLRQ